MRSVLAVSLVATACASIRPSPERTLQTVAIHEAGHAVVARHLGWQFISCEFESHSGDHYEEWAGETLTRPTLTATPLDRAKVLVAGHIAEERIEGYTLPLAFASREDYAMVARLGSRVNIQAASLAVNLLFAREDMRQELVAMADAMAHGLCSSK